MKDFEKKEHPNLIPYDDLPEIEKRKPSHRPWLVSDTRWALTRKSSRDQRPETANEAEGPLRSYLGVTIIQGRPQEKNGKAGYAVVYPDGYVSWIPQETFERAYLPLDNPDSIPVSPDQDEQARIVDADGCAQGPAEPRAVQQEANAGDCHGCACRAGQPEDN